MKKYFATALIIASILGTSACGTNTDKGDAPKKLDKVNSQAKSDKDDKSKYRKVPKVNTFGTTSTVQSTNNKVSLALPISWKPIPDFADGKKNLLAYQDPEKTVNVIVTNLGSANKELSETEALNLVQSNLNDFEVRITPVGQIKTSNHIANTFILDTPKTSSIVHLVVTGGSLYQITGNVLDTKKLKAMESILVTAKLK